MKLSDNGASAMARLSADCRLAMLCRSRNAVMALNPAHPPRASLGPASQAQQEGPEVSHDRKANRVEAKGAYAENPFVLPSRKAKEINGRR